MTPPISWPLAVLLSIITVCISGLVWKGAVPSHSLFAIVGAIVGYLLNTTVNTLRLKREEASSKREEASSKRAPLTDTSASSPSDVDITKDFSADEAATKSEMKSIPPK